MNLENENFCAVALTRLPGLTQAQALQAIRHYGTARAAFADRGKENEKFAAAFADEPGLSDALKCAEEQCAFAEEKNVQILPISSPAYPVRLSGCTDAPAVLYYRGTANLNSRHIIAVVGTRKITDYGKYICRHLGEDLGRLLPDCIVVSGLAYGVDVHIHRAAMENGLETVGVMATGLDRVYPAPHVNEARQMSSQGGLLTEYITGTRVDKGNFVRRNRIVAGMASATVVVESASHGGALITARLAQSYGRDLMAFPGRVADNYSVGCNNLIRYSGAHLVTSARDILAQLGWEAERTARKKVPQLFPDSAFSPDAQAIVEALRGTDGLTQNRIIELTGLDSQLVASTLSMLVIEGTVCPLQSANAYALA